MQCDLIFADPEFSDGFMRTELETRLLHLRPGEVLLPKDISKPTRQMVKYCLIDVLCVYACFQDKSLTLECIQRW